MGVKLDLSLMEEQTLSMFENRELRGQEIRGSSRKTHNKVLHSLYSS